MFRKFIPAALGAALAALCVLPAQADWVPEKPITIIVPFGAGGSTDVYGRVFAGEMAKLTGWTVLVENRPGAGGAIGQLEVASAAPDGYTLGLSSTTLFSMAPFMPDGASELQPDSVDYLGTISLIGYAIIAATDAPFDDLKSLAAYSKSSGPAKMSSTSSQLTVAMEQIAAELGIDFVAAQTSGSGESLQLVAGRHADFTISGGVHVPYILDGRMKVIAHFTDERAGYAPDALTVEEQGATLPLRNDFLGNGPNGMPAETKAALAKAIDDTLKTEAVKTHGDGIYVTLKNLGPDGATADVMSQAAKWKAHFGK
jgi:tripartite-type tricarboxylate transporter receptor subunit TctC